MPVDDQIKITSSGLKSDKPVFTASARGLTATGGSEAQARVRLILLVVTGAFDKFKIEEKKP